VKVLIDTERLGARDNKQVPIAALWFDLTYFPHLAWVK
jgi:hypothetical protein